MCLEQLADTRQLKHLAPAQSQLIHFTVLILTTLRETLQMFFTSFSTVPSESVDLGFFMYRNTVICP